MDLYEIKAQMITTTTQSPSGLLIDCKGPLAAQFDSTANYLTNPNAVKKLWKGPESYLPFGPYNSKVMIRGNDAGVPICYLKGGPGSAPLSSAQKRYWQPDKMRVALSSWRGCGDSTPLGGTEENTTQQLLEDIETMRQAMGVERMLLTGYCWGATVAFEYAKLYPERTLGIAVMLPYLARDIDIAQGFGAKGIAKKYPEAYQNFAGSLQNADPRDIFAKYAASLNQDLRSREAIEAYINWVNWEYATSGEDTRLTPDDVNPDNKQDLWAIAGERINVHYLLNNYFLPSDGVTSSLRAINDLARQGKPVMYISNELDPLMAPDHLAKLQTGLPDADSLVIRGADWHWVSPRNTGGRSNIPVENGLAFMVQKAVGRIQQLGL